MRQHVLVLFLAATLSVGAAAAPAPAKTSAATPAPSQSGEVWLADLGSARGFVIEAARLYEARGSGKITVLGASTESALEAVAQGKRDLVATSRGPNMSDAEEIDLKFTPVAWDALAFIVNPKNPLKNLTLEQLRDVVSGRVTQWSAIGGSTGLINLYAVAGPNDGIEWSARRLLLGSGQANTASKRWYLNTQQLESAVGLDPTGIGVTLLSNIHGNAKVRALSIDGVAPSLATMRDDQYPLLAQMYLVSAPTGIALAQTQRAKDFISGDEPMLKAMRAKQMLPFRDGAGLDAKRAEREQALADRLGFTFKVGGIAGLHQPPSPGKASMRNALRGTAAITDAITPTEPQRLEKNGANALGAAAMIDGALGCRPVEICQPAAAATAVVKPAGASQPAAVPQ